MSIIYYDTETQEIDRGRLAPIPVCASWAPGSVELWLDVPFRDWLASDDIMCGANLAFDMLAPMAADQTLIPLVHAKYLRGQVRDVLLDCKLLDIAEGKYERIHSWSLAACMKRATGVELEKDAYRKRYWALRDVPTKYWPSGALKYALDDALATQAVDEWNQARAAALPWPVLGHHSVRACWASLTLSRASAWGVLTSESRTAQLSARVDGRIAELREQLEPSGLVRKNGTKCMAAAAAQILAAWRASGRPAMLSPEGEKQKEAAVRRGMPEEEAQRYAEDAGMVKLDKDASILSGDELMIAYSEYTSVGTLRARVERAKQGYVLPLQTRFNPLVETARTSSSQPDEPVIGEQMQNFPRGSKDEALGLREVFEPRAGNKFLSADLGLAELHALAQLNRCLFGWTRMGELLDDGVDLHWYFAAQSRGIDPAEMVRRKDEFASDRDRAKPLNFGIPGGMGPDKIVLYSRKGYGVRFTREEVVALKKLWLATFPEMRLYFKWVSEQCEAGGGTFTHVHPITGFVRGDCGYTDGANHGFQHLTAYGAKDALSQVDLACFTPGNPLWGFRIWNFVHDEILLEGPAALCQNAAVELKAITERAYNAYVPDYLTTADPIISGVWSKRAKTVFHEGKYAEWMSPVSSPRVVI